VVLRRIVKFGSSYQTLSRKATSWVLHKGRLAPLDNNRNSPVIRNWSWTISLLSMELTKLNRKQKMIKMRKEDKTFQVIGNYFGVSRERARQIIHNIKTYIPTGISNAHSKKFMRRIEEIQKLGFEIENIAKLTGMKGGSRDRLRELVRIRDNHTCQICGKVWDRTKRRLDVHHLDENLESDNGRPCLMNKLFNRMITVCHKCHLGLPHIRKKHKKRA